MRESEGLIVLFIFSKSKKSHQIWGISIEEQRKWEDERLFGLKG